MGGQVDILTYDLKKDNGFGHVEHLYRKIYLSNKLVSFRILSDGGHILNMSKYIQCLKLLWSHTHIMQLSAFKVSSIKITMTITSQTQKADAE